MVIRDSKSKIQLVNEYEWLGEFRECYAKSETLRRFDAESSAEA
jgi:hypothetical protein